MSINQDQKLKLFLKRWPLEKVKTMSLKEYNKIDDKDSFCYWLEFETRELINISGQANSFKFEIFERKDKNRIYTSNDYKSDDIYSWRSRAGDNRDDAFQKTKANIIRVINATLAGNFKDIDSKEIKLAPLYKWKIAFLYSNKQILAISHIKAVKWLAMHYGMKNYKNARISSVHKFLIDRINKNKFWEEDRKLWNLYKDFHKNGQTEVIEDEKTLLRKGTEEKDTNEYFRTIHILKKVFLSKEHNKIQQSIYETLLKKYSKKNVKMEKNFIDIRIEHENRVEFIEVKCESSAMRCIRMALGQVLEYAFIDETKKNKEVIIFGNQKPNEKENEYIFHLQKMIPDIKFSYLYSLDQL